MTTEHLWEQLLQHEMKRTYVFSKAFITIGGRDFVQFEPYFTKQNVVAWNSYENLRSEHWYNHIHAIRQPNGDVSLHLDHGNPNTHWLLNIPHGVIDVIPYFVWCLFTWRKPYTI